MFSPQKEPDKNPSFTEKIRFRIACFAFILAILAFVAFIITDNTSVLLATSGLAYPLIGVIKYYFKSDDKEEK